MPELPEVEIVKQSLKKKIKDKRIIILSSRNIVSGWYNNIYNPAKGTNQ